MGRTQVKRAVPSPEPYNRSAMSIFGTGGPRRLFSDVTVSQVKTN